MLKKHLAIAFAILVVGPENRSLLVLLHFSG